MTRSRDLPPFDFHDCGVSSLQLAAGDITLMLDHVREGQWSTESGHELDAITLIEVVVVFKGIGDLRVGGRLSEHLPVEGDSVEVMTLEVIGQRAALSVLWHSFPGSHREEYQTYSFSFGEIEWRKVGVTPDDA